MEDNKKTLVLSIVGILVLVIAVVGVSFAMYSFTGSGEKVNRIRTGSVTLNFDTVDEEGKTAENSFDLDNSYPMSAEKAQERTDNYADFSVNAEWGSSSMTIYYDLGIEIQPGYTLNPDYVKVILTGADGNAIVGGEEGVTLSSLATTAGPNNLITTYGLTGGTFNTTVKTANFGIRAWVSEDYDLAVDAANSTTDNEGELEIDQADGSALHKKQTKSETLSFKLKLVASQTQGA